MEKNCGTMVTTQETVQLGPSTKCTTQHSALKVEVQC